MDLREMNNKVEELQELVGNTLFMLLPLIVIMLLLLTIVCGAYKVISSNHEVKDNQVEQVQQVEQVEENDIYE